MGRAEAGPPGLAAAVATLGFLLPPTLITRAESLALHLTPAEIALAYGTAWLLHLVPAIIAGLCAALLGLLIGSRLARTRLASATLVGLFALGLYLGARPLLESLATIHPPDPRLAAPLSLGFGALLGWLAPGLGSSALPAARAAALAGLPLAIGALLFARPGTLPAVPAPAAERPDILIITLDSFANSHVSAMGYSRPTTPALDRLAASGALFEQMIASGNYTTPTIATMLTGQQPWRHKANQLKSRPLDTAIAASFPARLHAAGYRLDAVTTNPFAGVHKNGFGRYFETVSADRAPFMLGACLESISAVLPLACPASDLGILEALASLGNDVRAHLFGWPPGHQFDSRLALADAEALWSRPSDGRPRLLWVHLTPPHSPYVAPVPWLGRFDPSADLRSLRDCVPQFAFAFAGQAPQHATLRARYDEGLAAADAAIGAFLGRLGANGQLRQTVIIVSADHGESFRSDYGGHGGPMLHGALTNIPFLLAGPGIPAGRRISTPAAQADIAATVIALAGLAPEPSGAGGQSLLPLLDGRAQPDAPVFTGALEAMGRQQPPSRGSFAMLSGDWKYVHYWGQPDRRGYRDLRDGLFHVRTDREERHDLSGRHPELARAMRAAIDARLATLQ